MQRLDQALYVGFRRAQNVKRQTLRRLLSDTRQAFEFVDEFGNGFGVVKHFSIADCGFEEELSVMRASNAFDVKIACGLVGPKFAIRNPKSEIKTGFRVPVAALLPTCLSSL